MSIYSFQFFLLVKQEQALHNGWSDLKTDSCLNGCDRAVVLMCCVFTREERPVHCMCVCVKNDDVSVKWFDSKEYKKEERRKKIIIIIIIIKHTLLF